MDERVYYTQLALAYLRGAHPDLDVTEPDLALRVARERGIRLHRFKRTADLPRVRRVLGILQAFRPQSLLDVGSGRGAFLWPLLDQLPWMQVTSIDSLEHRARDIRAVAEGGIERLTSLCGDAACLPMDDDAFDAVTLLEVLEHQSDPAPMAREAVRVAKRLVVATVPSKPDNNPEHVQLFTGESLRTLLTSSGATRVQVDYVLGHIVAVAHTTP